MNGPPFYYIYGEPPRPVDLHFVHVERVSARHFIHGGKVVPHRHDHLHQLSLWHGGAGKYFFDGEQQALPERALTLMPAGTVHGFEIEPTCDAIVVSMSHGFRAEFIGQDGTELNVLLHRPALLALDEPTASKLDALFTAVEEEYRYSSRGQAVAIAAYLQLVLVTVNRLMARDDARTTRSDNLLSRFLTLVDTHFQRDWTIQRIADELGTTPYLLNAATRDALARKPSDLLRERAIAEAKRLLLYTALSVNEVAFSAGYKDTAHFSRSFRASTGHSPGMWRRLRQEDAAKGMRSPC